ncbi:hypothetical protein SEA_JUBIE_134 [Mycobacterium phage Jubie]|nr:hypothetical protein SEA_JUBIE_134 [Mycobacterium phage Jubie]
MLCGSWAALLGAVCAPTALARVLLGVCVPKRATALLGAPGRANGALLGVCALARSWAALPGVKPSSSVVLLGRWR